MNHKKELIIRPVVEKFVSGLNGRYREHVSDTFLTVLLIHALGQRSRYGHPDQSFADRILKGSSGEAYTACCWIFENLLEHGCCAGGNGHHVAQAFDKCFKGIAEDKGGETS